MNNKKCDSMCAGVEAQVYQLSFLSSVSYSPAFNPMITSLTRWGRECCGKGPRNVKPGRGAVGKACKRIGVKSIGGKAHSLARPLICRQQRGQHRGRHAHWQWEH